MFPERRLNERKKIKLLVKCSIKVDKKGSMSVSEDVSLGGIYFYSLTPIPIGQKVFLDLSRTGRSESFSVEARIVRCEPDSKAIVPTYGIAAEFFPLSHDERHLIQVLMYPLP
jgi:Tfp pilus assembly protein PilZ